MLDCALVESAAGTGDFCSFDSEVDKLGAELRFVRVFMMSPATPASGPFGVVWLEGFSVLALDTVAVWCS